MFNKRILTKNNLLRRGVVLPGGLNCIRGCGNEESINHLFLGWLFKGCFGGRNRLITGYATTYGRCFSRRNLFRSSSDLIGYYLHGVEGS